MNLRFRGRVPFAFLFARAPLRAAAALAVALPAAAQTQLDPIVVTATRTASRASAVLGDITVISREDIERSSGRTLAELLARQAGLQSAANGGLGKASTLFVRGTEGRHLLLLVDGVRYGSATAGTPTLDNFPLEQIERIEVLKGPASALYGSDAVGGVVQIFTRRGAPGMQLSASATAGSAGRRELAAGLRGGSESLRYAVGAQTLRERGFSATNRAVGSAFNPDRDGFDQQSLSGSVDWRLAAGWHADARLLESRGDNRYDNGAGPFDVRAESRSQVLSAGIEGPVRDGWTSRLAAGRSEDRSLNFGNTAPPTRFDTVQEQLSWIHQIASRAGSITAGLERTEQQVRSTTAYSVGRRSTDSVFAGLQGTHGVHSWQLNARHDSDSQFGHADTGLVSWGLRIAPQWRAHAAYGSSFKAPTFNQLYFPGFGNPDTQPERGRNREVGLAWSAAGHEVSLLHFDNRIRGFITPVAGGTVANVPRSRIEGWTLSAQGSAGALGWRAALDLLDARNLATGQKLARRADRHLTAGADYATGAWKLGATLLAASARMDYPFGQPPARLGGYATLDVHADYALARDWTLQARMQNAADKAYATALGYNQPGRAVFLTARYAPR